MAPCPMLASSSCRTAAPARGGWEAPAGPSSESPCRRGSQSPRTSHKVGAKKKIKAGKGIGRLGSAGQPASSASDFLANLKPKSSPGGAASKPSDWLSGGGGGEQYVGEAMERALGVDFGVKFTGVAVSSGGLAPRELRVLRSPESFLELAVQIADIAVKEGAHTIVVGLPVTTRGALWDPSTDSRQGRRSRNFAHGLAICVASQGDSAPAVVLFDERNTSQDATEALGLSRSGRIPKGRVDGVAAALLLSRYFESPFEAIEVPL